MRMAGLRKAFVLLLLAVLPLARMAHAQTVTTGPDSARVDTRQSAINDSLRRTEKLLGWRVTRPQKAALLALVLPGAGQIYNHQFWKLPLVYGGLGGIGYGLFHYQSGYKEYVQGKKDYQAGTPIAQLSGSNVRQEQTPERIERGIIFYRGNRDKFIAYSALVYGVTILDALVAAHLRDFDISEDLSMRMDPMLPTSLRQPTTGLALTFTLK